MHVREGTRIEYRGKGFQGFIVRDVCRLCVFGLYSVCTLASF